MRHEDVEANLILYLDRELTEKEMKRIDVHLLSCAECARKRDLLQSAWKSESIAETQGPSPFLWTRLEARIAEYEQSSSLTRYFKRTARYISAHPINVAASIAAILLGIFLGTPSLHEQNLNPRVRSASLYATSEFDLNIFDLVPRNALGSALVNGGEQKK